MSEISFCSAFFLFVSSWKKKKGKEKKHIVELKRPGQPIKKNSLY